MLEKFFDIDNPVMRFLSEAFDLMALNILALLLCIPIVTAVPSLVALHYMTLKMVRKEESYIVKPFFKSFKENFKQSFIIGLIFIAAFIILYMDYNIVYVADIGLPAAFRIILVVVTIIILLLMIWVIPLQSHFVNTLKGTFRNSVLMSLANFPRTLLMALIWLIPLAVAYISAMLWPLLFLYGLSVPAYLSAKVYSPAFKRFEPEQEEEVPDEYFSMDEGDLEQFQKDLNETFGDGDKQ